MSDNASIPLGPPQQPDAQVLEIVEKTKHDVLHKIWELHRDDEKHHLSEVRKLEHLKFYHPILYRLQELPYGHNFFVKIKLDEQGHCVHARLFKSAEEGKIDFHAIHYRPSDEGGAVFAESDELTYFEY